MSCPSTSEIHEQLQRVHDTIDEEERAVLDRSARLKWGKMSMASCQNWRRREDSASSPQQEAKMGTDDDVR